MATTLAAEAFPPWQPLHESSAQVWSRHQGYPGDGRYLEFHKKRAPSGHRYWRVTDSSIDLGDKLPYDDYEAYWAQSPLKFIKNAKTPTLVMVGEQDILKGRRFADLIAGCIRGAELAVVPGAGHALCIEKPDIFNSLVLGFINKHTQ